MKLFLDTNCLIRFITNDVPDQAKKAKATIEHSRDVYLPAIVIAETVYILENHYQASKKNVIKTLLSLLNQPQISAPNYVGLALEIYREENLSFYDCLILAETLKNKAKLDSFDQKLIKVWERLK